MNDLCDEYAALMHAVQTGVALEHQRGSDDGSPKHLRTGVNSCMVTDHAIATLLIEKGIFTELEYVTQLVKSARQEKERYEKLLGVGLA